MKAIDKFFLKDYHLEPDGLPFRMFFYQQWRYRLHDHDFYELVVVLDGQGVHCVNDKSFPISAGDVFVIKPGMIHGYRQAHLQLANILIDMGRLNFEFWDLDEAPGYFALFETEPELRERNDFKAKLTLTSDQLTEVRGILQRIHGENVRKSPGYRFGMMTLFQELLLYIVRSYSNDQRKYSRRMVKLSRMMQFIENNYQRNISRDEIMAAGEVSNCVGSRIFQELVHESPIEHLIRVRIQHASELLRSGEWSVSEIAFRCGFRDSNYFSLQFKKITGFSPREFARNQS